jgi:uncharacterized protein (DUF1800 family)
MALLTGMAAAAVAAPLGQTAAMRLLTRAGFAPSAVEVARVAPLTQAQAVDQLLAAARRSADTPPPAWTGDRVILPREIQQMSADAQREYRQTLFRQSIELRGWWLREMAGTPSPLTERMTLFWHNHFVTAQPKVRWPQLLYRQNLTLREHALGSFATLLDAMLRDPALLVYLDAPANRRGQPNENLARELMELFTLGEGQYAERDVKEAARALTGLSIDPTTAAFTYRPFAHDAGRKQVLGADGTFGPAELSKILLQQPATARFIVTKLWREFVSTQPDATRVEAIADAFRASGYQIPVAVRGILMQPEVVAAEGADLLIKSPVELVIGLVRQSGGALTNPGGAALAVASMGQNLFGAPNVRGWPGGEAWINTQTLLARKQFIDTSVRVRAEPSMPMTMAPATDMMRTTGNSAALDPAEQQRRGQMLAQRALEAAARVDASAWLGAIGLAAERPLAVDETSRIARSVLLAPGSSPVPVDTLAYDALRATLLDPAYQLK